MKTTWHLVKKDLRALRWPLVLWIAVLATKIFLGVALLSAGGPDGGSLELDERFRRYGILISLLTALEYAGILLVARLVHEDPLVGSTAFWPTRPVSGGRLLVAKLAGLGIIFGLIPVLVALPWWVGCHLGAAEIAWAAGESCARHLLVALAGLFLAALTDGLGRFMLWLVASLALVPLTSFNLLAYFSRRDAVITADLSTTRFLLAVALAVTGMAVVIVLQYLTRRTIRSVLVAVATYLVVVAIGLWWPWSFGWGDRLHDWQVQRVRSHWTELTAPSGLTFTITGTTLRRQSGSRPDRPSQLLVDYRVDGLPENQMLVPATGTFTLRWPDATSEQGWSWARWEQSTGAALRALGLPARKTNRPGTGRFSQLLRHDTVERMAREPADYTLDVRFTLMEVAGTAEVVADGDGRIFAGSMGERLGWVDRGDRETLVTVIRHRALSTTDFIISLNNYLAGTAPVAWPTQYLLVNEQSREADAGSPSNFRATRVDGVEIHWDSFGYQLGHPSRVPGVTTSAGPTRLMRVNYQVLGNFIHSLRANPLAAKPDES